MAGVMETDYQYRGRAIIIANKNFINPDDKRKGSSRDLAMMTHLFTLLDFKVKTYKDLTEEQMLEKLNKAKIWNKRYEPSCFVCVISTHGGEVQDMKSEAWNQSLHATDGGSMKVDDITRMFSDANCEAYRGKPKLFFIQACRKNSNIHLRYDQGHYIQVQDVAGNSKNADAEKTVPKSDSADSLHNRSENKDSEKIVYDTKMDRQDKADLSDGEWDGTLSDDEEEDSAGKGDASDARGNYSTAMTEESSMPQTPLDCPKNCLMFPVTSDKADLSDGEWDGTLSDDEEEDSAGKGEASDARGNYSTARTEESSMPQTPLDCPKNCLIMFPVTSGRFAFRNSLCGSWMLYYLHKNRMMLEQGQNLFQYLTRVCGNIAQYSYDPDPEKYPKDMSPEDRAKLPSKMCACITHRLTEDVKFEPRGKRPLKDRLIEKMKKFLNIF